MRPALTLAAPLTALLLAAAQPAPAQEKRQDALFTLEIRGIAVGELVFAGVETDSAYAVSGTVRTTGLAGMLRKLHYDAKVQGARSSGRLSPARYEQSGGIGSKYSEEVVVWSGGLPRIERQDPPKPARDTDADPARQRGTIDTLTAIYATLRDVPPGQECRSDLTLYDGRYRMQVRTLAPRQAGDGVICDGEYIRLAGFSPKEMAERTNFPFQLHYSPASNGTMRVVKVTMDSLYGSARLVRR